MVRADSDTREIALRKAALDAAQAYNAYAHARQSCFADVPHRVVAPLEGTDAIMRHTFWVGVYPGLSTAQIEYTGCEIKAFLAAL
jgi:dTDP-4-amino-4,6-dideoxygalactose transaminase